MIEVVWSDEASEQLDDIGSYIEHFDPAAAFDIALRLRALAESLSFFPNRGRPGLEPGTREMPSVPPYVLTYEVQGDMVVILNVRHGRQMPRLLRR